MKVPMSTPLEDLTSIFDSLPDYSTGVWQAGWVTQPPPLITKCERFTAPRFTVSASFGAHTCPYCDLRLVRLCSIEGGSRAELLCDNCGFRL